MDQNAIGAFLRRRREALQPEDVGLHRGPRRRTAGLRREEVADMAGMSVDYLARLERGAGPQPSEQMITALSRGLRLTVGERDHLLVLAGHHAPAGPASDDHVAPGLMRVLDRLTDTPAQVMGPLGQTLAQNPGAVALLGLQTQYRGLERFASYRWFTDPRERDVHPPEDHDHHGRVQVSRLRGASAASGPRSPAAALVERLSALSTEFAALWAQEQVGLRYSEQKTFVHAEVGELSLHCQTVVDPDLQHALLVFTATPGSDSAEKLRLLTVVGTLDTTAR
jgi:transcriptional regulator with XRE-family HTH domain